MKLIPDIFINTIDLLERICTVAGKPDDCSTFDNSIHVGDKKLYPVFENYEGPSSYRIFITFVHRAYVNVDVCVSLPWSEKIEYELQDTSNASYAPAYSRRFKKVIPILKRHEENLMLHEIYVNTENKQLMEAILQYESNYTTKHITSRG